MKQQYDNIDEYIADLKDAILSSGGECAAHHYNLGLALLSKRDFVGAEEEFREALRESVHMAEAMVQLGGLCMQRGDIEGCLRYNTEATTVRPKFAVAESNIAFCHLQKGDPDKAMKHIDKALKWDPAFLQARNCRVSALLMKGENEAAEKDCRAILKDEPTFAPAMQNLAIALANMDRGAEALTYLEKAEKLGLEVPDGLRESIKA